MEDIGSIAVKVRNEVPFYNWLYGEYGLADEELRRGNVPSFTKAEFWKYEEAAGRPYYLSQRLPEDPAEHVLFHTSGTTGKPLAFPVRDRWGAGCQAVAQPMVQALEGLLGTKVRFWCQAEVPPAIVECDRQAKAARTNETVFIPSTIPMKQQLAVARTNSCNVLWDIVGKLSVEIVREGLNPYREGLRALVAAFVTKEVANYFQQHGCLAIFYYTSVDTLAMHVGCPNTAMNRFHMRARDHIYEVTRDDGQIATRGTGLYTVTNVNFPFPLVRYCNGDRVILEDTCCPCGYTGTDMVFLEREYHVKLGGGPPINYVDVWNYFSKQESNLAVTVVFGRVAGGSQEPRLYVFIEQDIQSSRALPDMSAQVLIHGAGGVDSAYLHMVRVFAVPAGALAASYENKRRTLVDLTCGSVTEVGQKALRLIRELAGEELEVLRND